MTRGLMTLADLPELAGADPRPRTTIAVARLDDRLKDPRYGAFKITQADVDGWKRNLAETFGGRVSVDFDHSSDRGRGTKAAAWITGLHQQGKLVTADVEFTPTGAKAVRDGDYLYISPTFVNNYTDEHGETHGKALLGAALTNRPVLRKGMPTLSLSRDRFDGVATRRRKKKSKKTQSKTLGRNASKKLLKKMQRELAPTLMAGGGKSARRSLDAIRTLAQFAPDGVQRAGTIIWTPSGASRVPPGLDDDGRALHALIAARAASTSAPYFQAMADVTGVPDYRALSDIPPGPVRQGMDPQREALDAAARAVSASLGISWFDALELLEQRTELNALQKDTGAASVPWLDTRPVSPPRPWSDEDWERDQRRANAAGIDIDRPMWQAGAEQGHDVVGELADTLRSDAIATHQQRGEGLLDQARAREDTRRAGAINDELIRRARKQTADLTARAANAASRSDLASQTGQNGRQGIDADGLDPQMRADLARWAKRGADGYMT